MPRIYVHVCCPINFTIFSIRLVLSSLSVKFEVRPGITMTESSCLRKKVTWLSLTQCLVFLLSIHPCYYMLLVIEAHTACVGT